MKRTGFLALAATAFLTAAPGAWAAGPELALPDFSHLSNRAREQVDITVDGMLLKIAQQFSSMAAKDAKNEQEAAALTLLSDIKSIRVRNFEFDADDAYSKADIEGVRRQLRAPGWSQLAQVRKREPAEDIDVYMCLDGEKILGLAVIASEPRSFTIVHIVGNIDIDKLAKLEGQFGIPKVDVEK